MSPKFSIIIPAYQAAAYLPDTLESALAQSLPPTTYEIIVVDDCSQDKTWDLIQQYAADYHQIKALRTPKNSGPGSARNLGVSHALGEWILFLDSDDTLAFDSLTKLETRISQDPQLDLIGYDWRFAHDATHGGRNDASALKLNKKKLLSEYASLRMDGSVIYTALRRDIVCQPDLAFASGFHEDVDYIYKAYWYAQKIGYLDDVLYYKSQRADSIVNTFTARHLTGFFRAWSEIRAFSLSHDADFWRQLQPDYAIGLFGVIATRLREVVKRCDSLESASRLVLEMYTLLEQSFSDILDSPTPETQYGFIARQFIHTMRKEEISLFEKTQAITDYVRETVKKSWSCVDLHHSVFLAPDEIRTCCKRFFVDGQMRGDVALVHIPENQILPVSPIRILKEKRKLHQKINQGVPNACSKCPFLEFKEWAPLDKLEVHYLSFEHHSVCNLKCNYCSDTYYGGKQARYDVKNLLDKMLDNYMLDECQTIVWGGGEPVVGKDFKDMLEKTVERLPKATQRVLTNSVKHSPIVERYLTEDKVSVTTSIDAGTEATFKAIRGMSSLKKVIKTLQRYAKANPARVTLKYIFTEGNSTLEEVRAFVGLIEHNGLQDCNFQISCDFKHEHIQNDVVIAMIALYGLLADLNCRLIFFDDLLRQRLTDLHADDEPIIRKTLQKLGLGHVLADKNEYKSVAVWGAGWQSKYLIENSNFFKNVNIEYFVDSRDSRIGEEFMNHKIVGPEALLESDIPVIISAVQGLPIIYQSFVKLGLDQARLVKQLII